MAPWIQLQILTSMSELRSSLCCENKKSLFFLLLPIAFPPHPKLNKLATTVLQYSKLTLVRRTRGSSVLSSDQAHSPWRHPDSRRQAKATLSVVPTEHIGPCSHAALHKSYVKVAVASKTSKTQKGGTQHHRQPQLKITLDATTTPCQKLPANLARQGNRSKRSFQTPVPANRGHTIQSKVVARA